MTDTTLPAAILARQSDQYLLALAKQAFLRLMPSMDTSQQSFPHQLLEPFCLALAELYVNLEDVERRTSLATAMGADLDRLGELYGVARTGAAYATSSVTFTGTPGSVIPKAYAPTTQGPNQVAFATTQAAVVAAGGTVDVPVQAVLAGSSGNVGAGTIVHLTTPVPVGITAVTNANATAGGTDLEDDGPANQYAIGYRGDIHDLSAARGQGGAAKHLRKWVRQVSGVGGLRVLEGMPAAGWVQIVLVGTDKLPAADAVCLAVEDFLLDPWRLGSEEAEAFVASGYGVTTDTQSDASPTGVANNTQHLVYNASGQGTLTLDGLEGVLPQPGVWRIRVRIKRGASVGTGNLVQFGLYDETTAGWAKTRPNGAVDAVSVLTAASLSTTFAEYECEAAWEGLHPIQLRINRLVTDTTTQIWVDQVNFWSTMSRDDRDVGLTPATMRLQIVPATQVTVNVAATLTYALTGAQTAASVQAELHDRLVQYFADRALADDNDVRRASVEDVVYGTPGIADVTALTLNTGTANLVISVSQDAVLGTETWS